MSKTKEITEVKEAKKLNKLEIKKETISDLNVPNDDKVKGGITAHRTCLGVGAPSGTYTCPPNIGG
jgi:hypothetical protein